MCNITNQMIEECMYSTVTKSNHCVRQIKVELIIPFFGACMKYLVLHTILVFFTGRKIAQTKLVITMYILVPTNRVAFLQALNYIAGLIRFLSTLCVNYIKYGS